MNVRKALLVLFVFLLVAPPAWSEGKISVKDPWVRQNPPGTSVTAAYMVIENRGGAADELLEADCSCSASASLHGTEMWEGSMAMKKVASIEVPAGGSVALSPGGYHMMLEGISGDMKESVILELKFRSGARISVKAPVLSPSAAQKRSHPH
ncbi:MAG: copper chaperone PCu(A)C [Candidatus Dadabacteria bacterium]|nr:copper chaperone PCu(A)C [Candidatus Dadabacteria bacterium]